MNPVHATESTETPVPAATEASAPSPQEAAPLADTGEVLAPAADDPPPPPPAPVEHPAGVVNSLGVALQLSDAGSCYSAAEAAQWLLDSHGDYFPDLAAARAALDAARAGT